MPVTNAPLYPYGNTGITWLDALLKGMQHDPYSIMPGQAGSVLGKGMNASFWRDAMRQMHAMGELHYATNELPLVKDASGNLYRQVFDELSKQMQHYPITEFPPGQAHQFLHTAMSPTGGGNLHTNVPSQLAPPKDLAKMLADYITHIPQDRTHPLINRGLIDK